MTPSWTEKPLGEIMTLQRGFDLSKKQRREGRFPIISSSGAEDFHAVPAKQGPGVVTGRYGTIGKVYYSEGPYWPLNTTLFVSNFHGNNPRYCYYLLSRLNFHEHSGKTGVPGVNRNDLHTVRILAANDPKEQEAIAEALSDADALIEGLERLIAKKRLIKQGAMQDLLTAKRRLPGFSGEWTRCAIGSFTRALAGGTPSTRIDDYWGGDVPWMSSGELHAKRIRSVLGRITESGLANSAATVVAPGSVLIGLAGQGKTRGTAAINEIELCTNQSIASILPSAKHSSDFLFHEIDRRYDELRTLSTGDGGRGGLNLRIIHSLEVPFPSLEEQMQIGNVLNDMDAEIQALETRLEKARQVKEGMMQNLLTGRIRLV